MSRRLLAILLALAVGGAAAAEWPVVALPPGAQPISMGPQMLAGGVPLRLQGFVAEASPAGVAAWFRRQLGRPLVENQVGGKLVLGGARGGHYITVQLGADGQRTRGVVAVADLRTAAARRGANQAAHERLLARFPSGTRIVSALDSVDGARSARHVVLSNGYSEEVNRARLVAMLREEGMALEREARAGALGTQALPAGAAAGSTLFFSGPGKEAMAVISRGGDNHVNVVLNTINTIATMEPYK
ncbi:hypothetical protein ACFOLJ_01850 [Rugamonas sp. CCM 8940]|uniref:hypothetical protein n=1 Tax=Rugamonas sp. CCM 8940 TaxID=2765359 RepID=UPI0018F412E7|nr:hypothetical protein [Rugamonas sp. CCM 8940]MBJ7311686.1 hypothetical protein [Rugamonas sp. CCM 8940]